VNAEIVMLVAEQPGLLVLVWLNIWN